jgi:hypothetical protein
VQTGKSFLPMTTIEPADALVGGIEPGQWRRRLK